MPRLIKNSSFWGFVLVCMLILAAGAVSFAIVLWQPLPADDKEFFFRLARQHIGELIGLAVICVLGMGFVIDWIFRLYILPIDRLAEETTIIHSTNPGHRIRLHASAEVMRLVTAINQTADRLEDQQRSVQERIQIAGAKAEEEKNILSVVVAELPQGILICNHEGLITLYNERSRQMLEAPEPAMGGFVGLGRSVFGAIDKNVITHALNEITDQLRRGQPDVRSSIVTVGKANTLLRVETVPILSPMRELNGFVLILNDVTRQIDTDRQVDLLFQSLTMGVRASVASMRAAIEVIRDYPGLPQPKREEFHRIIHQETLSVSRKIDDISAGYSRQMHARWPLTPMRVSDLLEAITKKAQDRLGLRVSIDPLDEDHWVRVDSYSMSLAVIFLLDRLRGEFGLESFRCAQNRKENFICLDFIWPLLPVRLETLRRWEEQAVSVAGDGVPATLKDILTRHNAEIWSHTRDGEPECYLRVLLPAMEPAAPARLRRSTLLAVNRPVFFDFDLFSQPGQRPELDNRLLAELSYTVFDTETTGLDVRGGDEIIAIGAVRIVNGRLLQDECFDRLVNPRRLISSASVSIHGIQSKVLADQPPIEQVLPLFHKYAAGTILVGHNAAFDMRLLQEKETLTGIRFENPVLDTMLLSAVAHPAHKNHDIETIAERLGITIVGRHTALGDAIATGEIFLKLLSALSGLGIHTLGQAREASQKTYYARITY
jgi:DNA polymerase-3 subunit epsilon